MRPIAAAALLLSVGCAVTGQHAEPTPAQPIPQVAQTTHDAAPPDETLVDEESPSDAAPKPSPEPVPVPFPTPPIVPANEHPPEPLATGGHEPVPVTLAAILQLADEQNPQIGYARQRVVESFAQLERAQVMWLPSIRGGVNYNKHEGRIQDVAGNIIETSRGAFYTGLGANAVGASSPAVPGIYANFQLTDAIFLRKIAAQSAAARQAASQAVTNDTLFQVSQAYLELLRAEQELAIAEEIRANAQKLADITAAYAKTGEGLASDDDRAQTELALRTNDVQRANEAVRVASARLAQLLSLDPTTTLVPQELSVAPIELVEGDASAQELVATGLSNRPEMRESGHLVAAAVERLRREKYAPLLPSVLLGASYGGMSGGLGGELRNFGDRFDADMVAYWEVRNLGFGERAARREAGSRVDQARLQQVSVMDRVAREIVEAQAQVQSRKAQIDTARQAIETAESSYTRNLERIENAQGLPLEVLQSVQALGQARREYLRAVTDYNQAQFALHRALGWPAL